MTTRINEAVLQSEKRLFFVRIIIGIIVAVLLLANLGIAYYVSLPDAPLAVLTNVSISNNENVCAGDKFNYTYDLVVTARSVIDVDITVLRVVEPATMVYVPGRRAIFPGPVQLHIEAEFEVPVDDGTGSALTWVPGEYLLMVALTTPLGRTEPALDSLRFTIAPDCVNRPTDKSGPTGAEGEAP